MVFELLSTSIEQVSRIDPQEIERDRERERSRGKGGGRVERRGNERKGGEREREGRQGEIL